MPIRKFKPESPDKALGKIKGDTEFARLGHLNRLVDDINNLPSPQGPVVDTEGNVIAGDSADNPIIVLNGDTHFIPDFSGMLLVNDHYNGRVELWLAGSGDTVLVSYTQVSGGAPTNTLEISNGGYLWTNNDNFGNDGDIGITFTVIKTRNEA